MRRNTPLFVVLLIIGATSCDRASAYTMTEDEKKQAKLMTGYWSSTQDDVGFSGKLNADGTSTIVCGDPLETIKGSWWVALSPQRLVLQRKDKSLVEYKIVQSGGDSMKLQAVKGGPVFPIQKAVEVGPR